MKILFLIPSLHGGGAERVASVLCNDWAKSKELKISLLTFDSSKNDFYKLSKKVKRYCIGYHSQGSKNIIKRLYSNLIRLFLIRRVLISLKPDIMVAFMPGMNIVAALVSLFTGIPAVISERTYPPYFNDGNLFDLTKKIIYRLSKAFVAQTNCTALWAQTFLNKTRVSVIPNPIKFSKLSKRSVYKNSRTILAIGRLSLHKGFDMLIDAFYDFHKDYPDWKLLIAGEGEEKNKLEEQIARLKLNKNIALVGRTTNPEQYYQTSSIFVLSSRVEGFPNVLLEAMSHSLPAISFNCKAGPSDLIKNGKNGLLVPAGDTKALSNAMKKLAGSAALRKKLANEAVKLYEEYSVAKVSKKWIDLFKSITA